MPCDDHTTKKKKKKKKKLSNLHSIDVNETNSKNLEAFLRQQYARNNKSQFEFPTIEEVKQGLILAA